jgi:hypothetical protein
MEKELIKEFILEIYDISDENWKERIKQKFPELFKVEFEIGKWYKGTSDGTDIFVRVEVVLSKGIWGNGFSCLGEYSERVTWGGYEGVQWQLASSSEIEPLLWKEANRRGIFDDTKLEKHATEDVAKLNPEIPYPVIYNSFLDRLWNKNGLVYYKGQWATPLDPNKETMEEIKKIEEQIYELWKKKIILESKIKNQ